MPTASGDKFIILIDQCLRMVLKSRNNSLFDDNHRALAEMLLHELSEFTLLDDFLKVGSPFSVEYTKAILETLLLGDQMTDDQRIDILFIVQQLEQTSLG